MLTTHGSENSLVQHGPSPERARLGMCNLYYDVVLLHFHITSTPEFATALAFIYDMLFLHVLYGLVRPEYLIVLF